MLKWWLPLSLAPALLSEDCRTLTARGQQAFQERQLDLALASFEAALKACPEPQPLRVSLAQLLYLAGKEIEAEQQLKSAITADPEYVAALYALGRIYYQQKRYPEALDQFNAVVALEPTHYRAHDNLGLCHDALTQDADAIRHFTKALALVAKDHPGYDWAHGNVADFFLRRSQFDKAFQFAVEAARRNPESARNAFLTGKALVKLEKHDLSLRWLEQSTKLDPDYAEAWYLLAQAYRKLERNAEADRALGRFKEASAKQPLRR